MIDRLQEFKGKNGVWCRLEDDNIIHIECGSYDYDNTRITFYSGVHGQGSVVLCVPWSEVRGFGDIDSIDKMF